MNKRWVQAGFSAVSLGLAATLVVFLPQIVENLTGQHVSWTEIGSEFGRLSPGVVALMAALWFAQLWAYTFVMTGSLPGLTHLQALTLNGSGSAVSNLLPFGGAVGVALTFSMARGWGFANRPVLVSTLVTGIWNTLFRFLLPVVGIIALLATGKVPDARVASAAVFGALLIITIIGVLVAALYWEAAALLLGRALDALVRRLPARTRRGEGSASAALHRLRGTTAEIIHGQWPRLTLGMVFFLGIQWALLVVCLHATGAYPGLAQSLAAFALSRVLTTAVVTPSGSGISEASTIVALVAMGAPAGGATAPVLLFWWWTYLIEIPWGGLALGAWALLRRRDKATVPARETTPSSH
jgi:uncharacterized membrane protein YbhN (UPF0104 family)